MSRFLLVSLAMVVLLAACRRAEQVQTSDMDDQEQLYFEVIGSGQSGNLSDTTEVVLQTPDDWNNLKDSLDTAAPFPVVDFSQTMLMVAALPQTSGGYRIQFESIEKSRGEIVASYVVYAPGPDCLTIMALTLPFQVITVRRAEGNVSFRRRVELESCAVD